MAPKSFDSLDKILQYTAVAANALQDVAAATQIPFLDSFCTLSLKIIPIVQATKFQTDRCLRIMEDIHQLLCALMSLCIHSDEIRSPKMLDQIAQCVLTLQKFHACLRAQGELGKIKRLFKQNEIIAELDHCEADIKASLQIFGMESGVRIASTLAEYTIDTESRHQELLELLSSQSGSIDIACESIGKSSVNTSSGSLSLLPPSPKIFLGRESELKDLIDILYCDPARAAIMGPGGMGKTTLAMAALHHAAIIEKYNLRHFISCESANTCADMVAIIGLHLGLEPSSQLSRAILRHLAQCGPCLIVLDNFETPWEPIESRGGVEDFLSLLADIPSLALLVTMRGAERPGKVKWNRPFLPPLEPLPPSASRQIFVEVADEPRNDEESALEDLLDLSGNLPLAVSLMANIASFEGYSITLSRWETENTALLAEGHDKRSNLETSITLSISSPRLSSSPHAKNLISLLSLLPDGIKPEDIIAGKVPIPNVRQCQSVLISTSLAYLDVNGRLKALTPVREYMRHAHPPSPSLCRPLRTYFQDLLKVWRSKHDLPSGNLAPDLVSHLGNINQLILAGLLTEEKSACIEMGESIITLESFSAIMLKGSLPLFQRLPRLIEETDDAALRWKYRRTILLNRFYHLIQDPDILIKEGVQYFNAEHALSREAVHFHNAVACHYIVPEYRNISKATEFNKMAFALAKQADDISLQLLALETEQYVALGCANPAWVIQVGHKVRDIVGFISMGPGARTWLIHEAWAHHCMGDLSRALDLCAQAENQFTSIGMERSDRYLATLDIRGSVHSKKSEYAQAREMYLQMVEKTSATSAPRYHAHALWALVEMNIRMEAEVAVIISSLRTAETMHIADGSCGALYPSFVAAELKLYCGDTQNGRAALLECLSKSRGIREEAVGSCLATLSDPVRKMHGPIDTLRWAVVYLAFLKKRKDVVGMPHALRRLADIYIMIDDDETTALHLFHAALEAGTKMDIHRLRAQCMVGIGDIMLRRGDRIQAEQMWEAAHPLFVRSAQKKDAASVKKRLEKLCQQDNPHSLQAISERAFDESTDSASGLYKSSDGDTTAVEMRVKIARTSAGTNHLSFAASRNHRNVN